jgi:diguanylate cyclase (GGDEF)-like protein/PAS domain S-box-containing protein
MKQNLLQKQIIAIFSIPMLTLLYFSYSFIELKYTQKEKSHQKVILANATHALTTLVHNIQRERGLSSGYLVDSSSNIQTELKKQYIQTDKALQKYFKTDKLFKKIKFIRNKVLMKEISVSMEMNYYTNINRSLLEMINSLIHSLNSNSIYAIGFFDIQKLKEVVGLQRALIYNHILKNGSTTEEKDYISELLEEEKNLHIKLNTHASKFVQKIYNSKISTSLIDKIKKMKEKNFKMQLTKKDASIWFNLSSVYINDLNYISQEIIDNSIKEALRINYSATKDLYITAFLWVLSIMAYILLLLLLKKLLKKQQMIQDSLRIASYTFDSHEAMTITDLDANIINVNKAFTEITGYTKEEVLGKKTSVLKSLKHSKKFYQDMWHKINTEGRWSDEIYNKRKNGEVYLEHLSITAIKNTKGIVTNYIAQFLDISELKNAKEKAQYQADHDFLTGLYNRKALIKRLQEEFTKAKRHSLTDAFLFLDLDEFKAVNDNYGHIIGDKLLVEVTHRVKNILREEDIFSRMSGDEFAIILTNLDNDRQKAALNIKEKCNKIIQAINQEFIFNEYHIKISVSIGAKIFPNTESTIEEIITHADTAMYKAKSNGKNNYMFYDKSIEASLKSLAILENELKIAIKSNQFKFYLQPKTDVKSGIICGAETLIRWQHPKKGLIYPNDFLETARSIGLIPEITKLALRDSCIFLKEYAHIFTGTISINISVHELLDRSFENDLISILNEYSINPKQIELEILEDDLIQDMEFAIQKIDRLKKIGFKLSIDDFGTGYSSITYLKKLPVDSLKIDRNFIMNLEDQSNKQLIKLMIDMAKTFNMITVVEGVEGEVELEYIKECGADKYQGYYCSPAVEKEKFISLLNQPSAH